MSHAYHPEKPEDDDEPLRLIDIILVFAGVGVIIAAAWFGWESVNCAAIITPTPAKTNIMSMNH